MLFSRPPSFFSMNRLTTPLSVVFLLNLLLLVIVSPADAAAPSIEQALQLTPRQKDIEYDRPTDDAIKGCTIQVFNKNGQKGWVVQDPTGQILRRFYDSNADNVVDQWSFYRNGIEVYRDIDANFNRRADQHRWLNVAGRRWGIDRNEDGRIETWKAISAQEVSAELVAALARKDVARFRSLLLTEDELKDLGLATDHADEITKKLASAEADFKKTSGSDSAIGSKTKWVQFSAIKPGVVPQGTEGSTKDLVVYENAVAMIDTDGKSGLLQIGTLIQVGDAWRLIGMPTTQAGVGEVANSNGFFFHAPHRPGQIVETSSAGNGEQLQKLFAKLEQVEKKITSAPPADLSRLYGQQADLLDQICRATTDRMQKETWQKQLADNISAAVQAGNYSEGIARLETLSKKLENDEATNEVKAYVQYRRLLAGYSLSMQSPKADYPKIQEQWTDDLESFVKAYDDTGDTPEAMLQLAIALEFAGEEDKAKAWYGKVATNFSSTPQAAQATGARRRLDSVGKVLPFRGNSITKGTIDVSRYKGRIVVIQYWATWSEPCKEDIPALKKLVAKYGRRGFSVVSVNVDNHRKDALAYLKANRITWPTIHEPGGMESRPASELGVQTLPTMLLLDQRGRVVHRNIHVAELEAELKKRFR